MEQWIGSVHSKMAWRTHFFFYLAFIAFWKRALHIYCARYLIQNIVFSFYVVPVLHINTFHYVNSVMLPLNQADKSLCKEWNKCTVGVAQHSCTQKVLLHKFFFSIDESGGDEPVSGNYLPFQIHLAPSHRTIYEMDSVLKKCNRTSAILWSPWLPGHYWIICRNLSCGGFTHEYLHIYLHIVRSGHKWNTQITIMYCMLMWIFITDACGQQTL